MRAVRLSIWRWWGRKEVGERAVRDPLQPPCGCWVDHAGVGWVAFSGVPCGGGYVVVSVGGLGGVAGAAEWVCLRAAEWRESPPRSVAHRQQLRTVRIYRYQCLCGFQPILPHGTSVEHLRTILNAIIWETILCEYCTLRLKVVARLYVGLYLSHCGNQSIQGYMT